MELNHLKHFYEVAKSGSFTAAARRLRISQSALSKAVQLLEDSGGVPLFDRSKSGVTLTVVGREVFEKCETLFETASEIENICRGRVQICEGPLRLGGSDHLSQSFLVHVLREMKIEFPALQPALFTASPNELVAAILNNEIEFALFFTKVDAAGIQYETLRTLSMALVCHVDLAPKNLGSLTPGDIKKFIRETGLITSIQSQYRYSPSADVMSSTGSPKINFESNSQQLQKQMCLEKGGLVYVARFMVEEDLKTGRLVELPMQKSGVDLHLATRRGKSLSFNGRAVVERLLKRLSAFS